jgi:hypothetical protein
VTLLSREGAGICFVTRLRFGAGVPIYLHPKQFVLEAHRL